MESAMGLDFKEPLNTMEPTTAAINHSTGFINGIIQYNPPAQTAGPLRQLSIEPWLQTEAFRQKQLFDNTINSFGNMEIVDEESPSVNFNSFNPFLTFPQGAGSSTRAQSKREKRRGGDLNRPSCNDERRKKKHEARRRTANNPRYLFDESGMMLLQAPPRPSRADKATIAFARKLQIDKTMGYISVPGQEDTIGPRDILIAKRRQGLPPSWATPEEQLEILKRNYREARSLKKLAEEKADSGQYGPCKRVVAMARHFWAVKAVELARMNGSMTEKEMDALMQRFGPKGYQTKQEVQEKKDMRQLVAGIAALWYGFTFSRLKDGS